MLCVTFDTDHINESRMAEFIDKIHIPGRATFFCTQRYTCLDSINEYEICPHPTLEPGKNWDEELQRMRDLFPEAQGWRSHSCVFSHTIAEWLANHNYLYASTNDQFGQVSVQPTRQPWGVWHLPIFYMDNMDFSSPCFWDNSITPFSDRFIEIALKADGLYVFDFHPIHLLLNTPNRDYYFSVRDSFKVGRSIDELVYEGAGTRTFFEKLCSALERDGQVSLSMIAALESYLACS